jgi:histidyl-tRNA synthetase
MSNNNYIAAKKLKGFQDTHSDIMSFKTEILKKIAKKIQVAGYEEIDTPCLEYSEVLLGEGGETDKQVYKFKDQGNRDVALRFDLTLPFARFIGEHHGKLSFPFKRYQSGKAWRAENPQRGRYREFSQCDLDIIGTETIWSDIDIISTFANILSSISPVPIKILLGQRALVSCLIKKILHVNSIEQENDVLIQIDKLNKVGEEKVIELICAKTATTKENCQTLLKLIQEDPTDTKSQLYSSLSSDENSRSELEKFISTHKLLKDIIDNKVNIAVDLSVVRGLGYYTGIVFESVLIGEEKYGSICSGGRYDKLTSRFTKQNLVGVGGSFGIDRFISILKEKDLIKTKHCKKIFITTTDKEFKPYGFRILSQLRSHNITSEIALKDQNISQQLKYANKHNFCYAIIIGDKENKEQSFNFKNMQTQEETKDIPLAQLVSFIRKYF